MWIHRVAGSFILLLNLIFISLMIHDKDGEIENNFHSILGLILLIIVTLGGVFTRSRMNRIKWNTKLILALKTIHKVLSLIFKFGLGFWLFVDNIFLN